MSSSEVSTVAISGSYNDLLNKPSIPDVSNYYTKTEADNEFLSSNQGSANAGKLLKVDTNGSVITAEVAGATVDDALSTVSTNPVQNKIITGALNSVVDYIPDSSITRKKLSFPTKPLHGIGTEVSESCANSVAELYLNPAIATLPSGYWVAKCHAGSFYCRPNTAVFNAYIGLSTKENNVCYEIKIVTTTDAENYPIGTLVGYVVFDDIETLKTLRDTGNSDSVNYNFCTNLSNNPVIAATIQASAGILDNSITSSKLVDKAVVYEKIDFDTLRPVKPLTGADYSMDVAEVYINPDITLTGNVLSVKVFGTTCYFNHYQNNTRIFRATAGQPTENNKVYEFKIDMSSDEVLYPINTTAGYIVFDDIADFLTKPSGSIPNNLRYEICKNLMYSPRINNYLDAEPTPDAPVTNETYNEDRNVEICLPDTLYAVVGDKIQLYHRSVLRCFNPYIYNTTVICNIGNNYPRYYELTPTLDQVGNHTLTYIVRDQNCKTLSTKTVNLKVVAKGVSPTNNMNVLCIGASATAAGLWPSELKRRLVASTGTPQGDGLSNITFVGRMSATPDSTNQQVNFEATGGYTFGSYVSTNDYLYKFYFANEHLPTYVMIGDVYSYSGTNYTITEINIPSTDLGYAGYISGRPSGNGGSTGVSGTLTRVSGTGDATITFDQNSRSGNPFCYDGVVDLQRYANEFCNGTIDLVYSQLVFNGAIINGTVEQIKAGANIANMITFANYLHTAFPNAKLGLGTGYNPDTKGGCGANYGASNSTEYGYKFYVMNLAKAFQEAIDENNLSDFVFVATNTPEVDSENAFPYTTTPVNTRSSVTEVRGTNGVHPTFVGQAQVADSYYRDFIARFCQPQS